MAVNDEWTLPGVTELGQLGEGTFGRVVLARHDASGQIVAIKYLFSRFVEDPVRLAEFRNEALALSRVASPHIARLYEFVETPQGAAIVLEAIKGVSLQAILQAEGSLSPESALAVLKGSLLGLAAAHAANTVHRDYKPGNVLVSDVGQSKLVDFGTAVLAGEVGAVIGTPSYMAPEQWNSGPATPATDVYAATCVFFQCVAGHRPYQAEQTEVLRTLHEYAPIPFGEAPDELHEIVALGMAKDPRQRPPSALAFLDALERVARAGYGEDWERRGWSRLAKAAGVLAALTPLALLAGASTAAAPVAVGAAAGTAATVGGTGGGVVLGVKVAIAVAVAAAVTTTLVVVNSNGDEPAKPPPAVAQAVDLKVDIQNRTGKVAGTPFDFAAQYVHVSGTGNAALEKSINDALTAPVDEWVATTGKSALEFQPEQGPFRPTSKASVRLRNDQYLSVLYEHGLDGAPHASWNNERSGVTVDLKSGKALTPSDLFTASTFTDAGMTALNDAVWADDRNACGDGRFLPIKAENIQPVKLFQNGVTLTLTPTAVEFTIELSRLGFEEACGMKTVTVPYDRLGALMNPDVLKGAAAGAAPPASPSATGAPAGPRQDIKAGKLTLHAPASWVERQQGLERVIVDGSCADPAKYYNCKYFLITDNTRQSAEQPRFEPGKPYRRSAGGRACNAAGRKDLRQDGDAVKTVGVPLPIGVYTWTYEEWTIQCVPAGQSGGTGPVQVKQRIWYSEQEQLVFMDEWGMPGLDEVISTATRD